MVFQENERFAWVLEYQGPIASEPIQNFSLFCVGSSFGSHTIGLTATFHLTFMENIRFTELKKDSYYAYHLPCGAGLFGQSLFNHVADLPDEELQPWLEYLWSNAITYLGTGENSLLYAHIVKFLAGSQPISFLHFGSKDDLKDLHCGEMTEVQWRLSMEYTCDDGLQCREYGYQSAEEFLQQMAYFNQDLSNRSYLLCKIGSGRVPHFIKTYGSDVSLWTFFVQPDLPKLLPTLQSATQRPSVAEILEGSALSIHLQIGGDEGYLDYIMIQSQEPLQHQIAQLEVQLQEIRAQYLALLSQILPIDADWKVSYYQAEMEKIFGIAVA